MFLQKLAQLLEGPQHPDREFLLSGLNYAHVYALAADIRDAMKGESICCLCTEDRSLVMASVLAALGTGVKLILPHSFSVQKLAEIRDIQDFRMIISDQERDLAKGMKTVIPRPDSAYFSPPVPSISPDAPIVSFFTGGSTGRPKIWQKTPRNLFAEAFFHSRKNAFSEKDCFLSTVPPYHIYGFLFSVLVPFVSSSSLWPETCTFPQQIRMVLTDQEITVLVSLPVHYRALGSEEIPENRLRLALSSAGKLDEADGDRFYAQTGTGPTEIYGSTETGGIASRCRAAGEKSLQPFDVIDWKITDEILHVRSDFLSPGMESDAQGYFCTGDRAIGAENGGFYLLGRADGIVKVGGKRVDVEEVGEKLKQIPGIADAVVISLPDASGRENDLAALVQGNMDLETFRNAASQVLEPYAMPRRVCFVEKIPRTSAGKCDRSAMVKFFQGERKRIDAEEEQH
ncbi:MAG: fatty acid--CoA ligase family protein [Desulfobacterales bacterium]